MGHNFCVKCGIHHAAPTGRKCVRASDNLEDNSALSDEVMANLQSHDIPPSTSDSTDDEVQLNQNVSVESRLEKLENMFYKFCEGFPQNTRTSRHQRSPSWSSTDSEIDPKRYRQHRSRKQSPSKSDRVDYSEMFDDDMKIASFEHVMIATFKTMAELLEEGTDISPLVQHGRFMAEKASAEVYVSSVFPAYDKFVRKCATKKGVSAFSAMDDMERSRFFNLENYREVRALKSKLAKSGNVGRPKNSGICFKYNSDAGCFYKNCIYQHKCSSCDIIGHPTKDCRVVRKDKLTK